MSVSLKGTLHLILIEVQPCSSGSFSKRVCRYGDLRRFFPTTCIFTIGKKQIWTEAVVVVSTFPSRVLTCSGGCAQLKTDASKVVASPSAVLVGG